jgi:hypothetical protein
MKTSGKRWRFLSITAAGALVLSVFFLGAATAVRSAKAGWLWGPKQQQHHHHNHVCANCQGHAVGPGDIQDCDSGGSWYWMRSPEQERRVVMSLYNRYCIRCHGVDGRGVWDIPDVPDFTNTRWQASRPEAYRARVIIEGRGAVMPPFRGTLTLEEAWGLSRYLYSFVPGTEVSRPDLGNPPSQPVIAPATVPAASNANLPAPGTPPPNPGSAGPFSR